MKKAILFLSLSLCLLSSSTTLALDVQKDTRLTYSCQLVGLSNSGGNSYQWPETAYDFQSKDNKLIIQNGKFIVFHTTNKGRPYVSYEVYSQTQPKVSSDGVEYQATYWGGDRARTVIVPIALHEDLLKSKGGRLVVKKPSAAFANSSDILEYSCH